MKKLDLKIVGTSPLLMSSDTLADPLNPKTIAHKQLTNKRKKTEDDHLLIARSQWEGLLYWDEKIGAILPSMNLKGSMVSGGKISKLGMQLKRGTLFDEDFFEIEYGKKKTIDQLWEEGFIDRRSVVVSQSRVMAYRPKFTKWSVNFHLLYDENILDEHQIMQSFNNAGSYCGIGGFRPEKGGSFGRFEVVKV